MRYLAVLSVIFVGSAATATATEIDWPKIDAAIEAAVVETDHKIDPQEAVRRAPQLPPWPTGLSEARETPEGVLLPPDLAGATTERLAACLELPGRCQARLYYAEMIYLAQLDGVAKVLEADYLAGQVVAAVERGEWTTIKVVLMVAGGVLAGAGAGVVAAIVTLR